jgi:hypothetical protein
MAHKTDGKLQGEISYSVVTSRLDIDGYLTQYDQLPPGMFKDSSALDEWLCDMTSRPGHPSVSISKIALKGFDTEEVVILESGSGSSIHYRALWVRAKYGQYRNAMKAYLTTYKAGDDGLKSVDADHVINRHRVKSQYPDAWLMLMPVPNEANRGFGSAIEKNFEKINLDRDSWLIEPVVLLKSFAVTSPKSYAEVKALISQLEGQMENGTAKSQTLIQALQRYCEIRNWSEPN